MQITKSARCAIMSIRKPMVHVDVDAVQKRKKVPQKCAPCAITNTKQTECAIADAGKSKKRNRPILAVRAVCISL